MMVESREKTKRERMTDIQPNDLGMLKIANYRIIYMRRNQQSNTQMPQQIGSWKRKQKPKQEEIVTRILSCFAYVCVCVLALSLLSKNMQTKDSKNKFQDILECFIQLFDDKIVLNGNAFDAT